MLVLGTSGIAQAQPQVIGQWETRPELMPINPVHTGLLRTGKVLVIAGSGNDPGETIYKWAVWDPAAGTEIDVQRMDWDVWCNGMSFLPDGRALITGGSKPYPTNDFKGLRNTTLFDPETSRFSRVEDMAHGRWYPTNVALPDGRTATFSGYDETGNPNKTFEIYTVGSGWSAERPMNWPATPPNYPRVHVTPAGDLFFSGSQRQSQRFDPQTLQWSYDVALTQDTAIRRYGSSVLLALRPPDYSARILIAGGGVIGSATNSAEVIDVSRTPLQWNQTGALDYARVQHNAVLLPNGRVLAVGGSKTNNVPDANGGGRFSEMYEPETGDWTVMEQQTYWRFYHSNALLLPDGRVASLGGNPEQDSYEQRIEIYSPSYLYTSNGASAPRPTMTGVPAQIAYAAAFEVTTADPGAIQEAVLMRPGAATHAFDMEQRLVEIEIAAVLGGKLRLVGPPNANIAPPGYYMLFLIDSAGVPSVATFVRLGSTADSPGIDPPRPDTPPPPPPNTLPLPPPNTPPPPSSPGGSVPNCSGHAATVSVRDGVIVGGRDSGLPYRGRLRGTEGPDVIVGTAGNDILQGFGGNDRICAGSGNDLIKGGTGNDRLYGQSGRDTLIGGAGSDRCRGGRGTDKVASCERRVKR